jgi:putative NADH-flavin reductase
MKIALIGATGNVGSFILAEAERRGHFVTAIARRIDALRAKPQVIPLRGDIGDEAELASKLAGHEAVISATKFMRTDAAAMIRILKAAKVSRWLVVGGAGSLEIASGIALVDTPEFPAEYRSEANAGRTFLEALRGEQELDWTFLSPSAELTTGQRSGKYRLGEDQMIVDSQGRSHISLPDYAVAMIDELERPRYSRRRFTVGY